MRFSLSFSTSYRTTNRKKAKVLIAALFSETVGILSLAVLILALVS
jgi:hypothetical protein